jgi:hypothetical protein
LQARSRHRYIHNPVQASWPVGSTPVLKNCKNKSQNGEHRKKVYGNKREEQKPRKEQKCNINTAPCLVQTRAGWSFTDQPALARTAP